MRRTKYEESLFTIRLAGEDLDKHGASIYDVAVVLLAMQRIAHKAYLAINDRLQPGQAPKREERRLLSLALGERKRASDAFGLVPIITDPVTQAILLKIADYMVSGVTSYFVGDIIERLKTEKDTNKKIFIGSIHADVVNIVNRIDAAGGVDSIQIGAPSIGQPVFSNFREQERDYVNSLKDAYYLGSKQKIQGRVYRFYPSSNIVSIRRAGGKKVDIDLNEEDFRSIRYYTEINPLVEFTGCPKYKLGVDPGRITDFVADNIEIIAED